MFRHRFMSQMRLDYMLECMEKEGNPKPLGQAFCENFNIADPAIQLEPDNAKAMELILKHYGPVNSNFSNQNR